MIDYNATRDPLNFTERRYQAPRMLVESGARHFSSKKQAAELPLSKVVFALPGVQAVYLMDDFVAVIASDDADWKVIGKTVRSELKRLTSASKSSAAEKSLAFARMSARPFIRRFSRPVQRVAPKAQAFLCRSDDSATDYELKGFRVSWIG